MKTATAGHSQIMTLGDEFSTFWWDFGFMLFFLLYAKGKETRSQ